MSEIKGLWIGGDMTTLDKTDIDNIKASGFTDLFIWSNLVANTVDPITSTQFYFQVGGANCLYYDVNTGYIYWNRDGKGNQAVRNLINNWEALTTPDSTIKRVHLMFGGGSPNNTFPRFTHFIFPDGESGSHTPQIGDNSIINRMFTLLKAYLPTIYGIQYDDEIGNDIKTNNALSNMFTQPQYHFNYKLSYIPFRPPTWNNDFWINSIKNFGDNLCGVYLQIYGGASLSTWRTSEQLKPYIDLIFPVLKGYNGHIGMTPQGVQSQMITYESDHLQGAGIWLYDGIANHGYTIKAYATALTT